MSKGIAESIKYNLHNTGLSIDASSFLTGFVQNGIVHTKRGELLTCNNHKIKKQKFRTQLR